MNSISKWNVFCEPFWLIKQMIKDLFKRHQPKFSIHQHVMYEHPRGGRVRAVVQKILPRKYYELKSYQLDHNLDQLIIQVPEEQIIKI